MPRLLRLAAVLTTFGIGGFTALTGVLGQEGTPQAEPSLRDLYSTTPDKWPAADWDPLVKDEDRHELGPVPKVEFPEDNPYSKAKSDLGWKLFYDPRLSGSAFVACVSCHHPDLGWADGKVTSQGHQLAPLDRNAPTLIGAALQKHLMWDGRAKSLEDQTLLPLADVREMHSEFATVEKNLNAIPGYKEEFKAVFGTDVITIDLVSKAIATFERTIVPGRSRFDAFVNGKYGAMDDQMIRGLHLFRTKGRCINCHSGPLLSDRSFHNVGLTYYGRPFEDLGLYHTTKKPEDVGKFRTPTLRNLSRTGPYMHNGLFEIEGVVNLYNSGMPNERSRIPNDPLAPRKDPLLKPLRLTPSERDDLIAFLNLALEEPRTRVRAPKVHGLYGVAAGAPEPADTPATQPAE